MTRTDNAKEFLDLLGSSDQYVRLDTMQLLQRLLEGAPELVHKSLLANPEAFGQIMNTMQSSSQDFIRNECLALILALTASKHTELLTIICFQGGCEQIISILLEETRHASFGMIAKSCLTALQNLSQHSACLKYMREAGCIASMLDVLKILSKPPEEGIDASETGVLVDLLLKCLSKFLAEDEEKERKMNILRFVKSGAVENMCRAITVAHLSIAAKISCVGLLARAARDPEVANRLCQYDAQSWISSWTQMHEKKLLHLSPCRNDDYEFDPQI